MIGVGDGRGSGHTTGSDVTDLALRNAYQRGEVAPGGERHVLVAAMPKSGSSLLIRLVAELPGFQRIAVVRGHDRRENELALDPLVRAHDRDWVAQAHVRHSTATARMMRTFSLRTVVQTRDLADVMVSVHDHLLNIAAVNPIAYVPGDFGEWPRERRLEFVVDTFAPWYLHFFLSWQDAEDVVRVGYAELLRDPAAVLARVAPFAERRGDRGRVLAGAGRRHPDEEPGRRGARAGAAGGGAGAARAADRLLRRPRSQRLSGFDGRARPASARRASRRSSAGGPPPCGC